MTTPTNDRQTSEREQIARDLLEYWPDDIECRAAAAQLRADERLDAEIAALRAENEALRTEVQKARQDSPEVVGSLQPHKSFIRSKEARRG